MVYKPVFVVFLLCLSKLPFASAASFRSTLSSNDVTSEVFHQDGSRVPENHHKTKELSDMATTAVTSPTSFVLNGRARSNDASLRKATADEISTQTHSPRFAKSTKPNQLNGTINTDLGSKVFSRYKVPSNLTERRQQVYENSQRSDTLEGISMLADLLEIVTVNLSPNTERPSDLLKYGILGLLKNMNKALSFSSLDAGNPNWKYVLLLNSLMSNNGSDTPASQVLTQLLDSKTKDAYRSVQSVCQNSLMSYVDELTKKKLWALKMFDASGKPPAGMMKGAFTWVGHFDECLQIEHTLSDENTTKINGSYCMVSVNMPTAFMPKSLTERTKGMAPPLRMDLCFPDVCSNEDLSTVMNQTLKTFGIQLYHVKCMKYPEPLNKDNQAVLAIGALSVIGLVTLCAAIASVSRLNEKKEVRKILPNMNDTLENIDNPEYENGKSPKAATKDVIMYEEVLASKSRSKNIKGTAMDCLVAFSPIENLSKILDVSAETSSLDCLHGIRVLSMFYIILGHTHGIAFMSGLVVNKVLITEWLADFVHQTLYNNSLAVDTFFLLSGVLCSYLFLGDTAKRGGPKVAQMIYFYIHRYWRIVPLYALAIMVYIYIRPHWIDGPERLSLVEENEKCEGTWWENFLFINNVLRTGEAMKCMGWSWYLAVDMQMFVISPIVLVPLVLFKWLGFAVIGLIIVAHIVSNAILYPMYPGSLFSAGDTGHIGLRWLRELYVKPYTRCGPYAVGLFLGYLLHKNIKRKQKLNQKLTLCLWLVSICLLVLVSFITHDMFQHPWSILQETAYQSTKRLVWAIALAWIIFACSSGHGGFVNRILSLKVWRPLSRITYACYLFHPMVIQYYYLAAKSTSYLDQRQIIFDYVGISCISYGISLVLAVFLESPWVVIEKTIRRKLTF